MRLVVVSVLFGATTRDLGIWLRAVRQAGRMAIARGVATDVSIRLGDCGSPDLDPKTVGGLGLPDDSIEVEYRAFGDNVGHSLGSNSMARGSGTLLADDVLVFLNPDALPEERALLLLAEALRASEVGVVDARQIPFEHPKWFDPETGRQSWASGACLGVRSGVFHMVGGFDDVHFWSYCNDVDVSWRIRLRGLAAVHVPEAVVFHDKRVDARGRLVPTSSQDFFSTLGRLNLAVRYGRPDVLVRTKRWVEAHGSTAHRAALAEFRRRAAEGGAPRVEPEAATVAQFVGGEYATHRF